ncbi:MAG TPA: PIN domain-containing protein [Bryobacteraceae bacterium]|nr:PIN domain-containing protein [Bryobacteraceae bacterium]
MKTRALDSWAILEWMNARQPACDRLDGLLAEAEAGKARLLMSAINVGEVYYFLWKSRSEEIAEQWRKLSGTLPVTIETPAYPDVWNAASLKARFPIAYADAFAAALALKHNCALVTGDPEFQRMAHLELDWIGAGPKPCP